MGPLIRPHSRDVFRRINWVAKGGLALWDFRVKIVDNFWVLCEVTRRRRRVSPCRSAYYVSPWWLLTLSLRDVGEKQLCYSQSRDGIWRWEGSRPSHLMVIPNTKRRPNNMKTDQSPFFEVITGLPRPYHNNFIKTQFLHTHVRIIYMFSTTKIPTPATTSELYY